jgi:hypothetical protein
MELLLQCPGMDPAANNNEALVAAIESGNYEEVRRLLQCPGVDPTALSGSGL